MLNFEHLDFVSAGSYRLITSGRDVDYHGSSESYSKVLRFRETETETERERERERQGISAIATSS